MKAQPARPRRGFTMVELVVAAAILALIFAVVSRNLRVMGLAESGVQKLDALQELRLAQRRVKALVETGTAVLFPAIGAEGTALTVVDEVNQLHLIYLDSEGDLRWMPRGEPSRVLARGVLDFQAAQPFKDQVEIRMQTQGGAGDPLALVITAYASNQFHGKVGP